MRDATFYASSLLELYKLDNAAERRASWRQAMAALARVSGEDGPGPLELIHRSCGHPAEPYLACAHCHEPLTARDITPIAPGARDAR